MNGAVIPNTPVAVDFWRLRQCPHSRIFFLSHMHTDHTVGLTSSWTTYTIYCSELTAKLLVTKLGVKKELVIGLPVDECVTVNLDETGKETLAVTLIDANHCPGAVMFVFEGYFGKILYTGDFRYYESIASHPAIRAKSFDILYLDNTYCDPKCVFPTRAEATIEILKIIRRHPGHNIVLGMHNLGKEALLHRIAVVFQTWIGVDPLRKQTLELLEMPNVFTCDQEGVRIRVVLPQRVTKKNLEAWNSETRTISILPTCLYVGSHNPFINVPDIFVVPYSDHSSFQELRKFVQVIRPCKIIPIVHRHRLSPDEVISRRIDMSCFQDLMDTCQSAPFTIPLSVQHYMACQRERLSRKKLGKGRQATLRKAASSKKPCGVIFPSSLDMIAMEDSGPVLGNVDLEKSESNGPEEHCSVTFPSSRETITMEDKDSVLGNVDLLKSELNGSTEENVPGKKMCKVKKVTDADITSYVKSSDGYGHKMFKELNGNCLETSHPQMSGSKKKFNIYNGCSCDFARKFLEEG